jgi:UDP-N-acetylglucosamine 4,6-dehydratase
MRWSEQVVLVTGGTGSFGRKLVEILQQEHPPKKLIVFSRDELKQYEMRATGFDAPNLRYFLGDVRDVGRLRRAMEQATIVVHAAALKQVPACEYNPIEAVRTNVDGGVNVIDAALDCEVERVLALSTDKAVNPVNLYGATKLVAEKLFVQANAYRGERPTRFCCARYGNVVGSRGSVVPLFQRQKETGTLTVTDPRMTRFWITLEQGARFVIGCLERMRGGEVFVPKIPSMNIMDLAAAIAPGCQVDEIGIRPGEKLHEVLVSEDEARTAVELDGMFVIPPSHPWWDADEDFEGTRLPDGFQYKSDENDEWLTIEDLAKLVAEPG